ncbi:MAG: fenitrothion hydrolase [Actinomycetes bacterium]
MIVRRSLALSLGALLVAAMFPTLAAAHGVAAKADLPIPAWMFAWAATLVLVVSFAGLAVLWREPVLAGFRSRSLVPLGVWADLLLGAFGVASFAVVCWAGLTGTFVSTANIAPTGVWVAFWVGVPIASALFGDVFRLLSPWRAVGRGVGWVAAKLSPSGLPTPAGWPERLGCRPAVIGLLGMVWLELAFLERDDPSTLAALALGYAAIQLVGMSIWGVETWSSRGDSFGVAFSLIAKVAPFERVDGRLKLRVPLSGVSRLEPIPGVQAVLIVLVGATSFDGFLAGPAWPSCSQWLIERGREIGFGPTGAAEFASTVGLACSFLVIWAIWTAGTAGAASALGHDRRATAAAFVGVLIPIALAYTVAHYASLLIYQGQALGYLASDPAGTGADWFGTARWTIDYGVVGPTAIWWVQLVALILGHVAALAVAHDRALEIAPDARLATRSQVPMLVATVAFTTLALWLLSAANL